MKNQITICSNTLRLFSDCDCNQCKSYQESIDNGNLMLDREEDYMIKATVREINLMRIDKVVRKIDDLYCLNTRNKFLECKCNRCAILLDTLLTTRFTLVSNRVKEHVTYKLSNDDK